MVLERDALLSLMDEPELKHNITLKAQRDVKPFSDNYLAVFVFSAESQGDGTLVLQPISTTVVGIQRYTTARLRYQGVHLIKNLDGFPLVAGTLLSHYKGVQTDLDERFRSIGSRFPLRWTMDFPNGAGDLSEVPQFVITDPDIEELERLFSAPDQRSHPEEEPEDGRD